MISVKEATEGYGGSITEMGEDGVFDEPMSGRTDENGDIYSMECDEEN